jgi:hypothetical protein
MCPPSRLHEHHHKHRSPSLLPGVTEPASDRRMAPSEIDTVRGYSTTDSNVRSWRLATLQERLNRVTLNVGEGAADGIAHGRSTLRARSQERVFDGRAD